MESLYTLLTFPQYFKGGYLYYNIMVLPRNIDLYKSLQDDFPSFIDATLTFETKIINNLDGLPVISNVTHTADLEILSEVTNKSVIYAEIIKQLEAADGLKISDDVSEHKDTGFEAQKIAFKDIAIRKYLPQSYRNSFNFTSSKTRYAITDDEYECIIKNKEKKQIDTPSNRNYISWGKLIAFIIRNPLLAEKAGLIFKARLKVETDVFANGGWLYTTFAADNSYTAFHPMIYACRIPKLKADRQLFAPVLFPVKSVAENNATYDQVMQESILYNDGFAKIVHANQPVSQDLLQETDSSNPPLKDIGIRLGWDDEQLTIWGNRQLKQKDEISDLPIDAPLGVFGYKVDVRKIDATTDVEPNWSSQNLIYAENTISFGDQTVIKKDIPFELPLEVHPSSHGDTLGDGFWLPMYYVSWSGSAMVIPDKEAQEVHQLTADKLAFDEHSGPDNALNTKPKKTFNPYVQESGSFVPLLYGEDYQFRIRLMDISGGGPTVNDIPLNGGQSPIGKAHFTRNIAASALKIDNSERFYQAQSITSVADMSVLENILDDSNTLIIRRPDLSYPSVVYTGKYSNAAALLKTKIESIAAPTDLKDRKEYIVALPDPDVNKFKVIVEVKSLEMDNMLSHNGKESYLFLQERIYKIPNDLPNENYDLAAEIKIVYKDYETITLESFDENAVENELVLPTSRNLRITIIPLVDGADNDYASKFVAEGKSTIFTSYKAAKTEKNLLSEIDGGMRAFYLQPEKISDRPANLEEMKILKKSLENGTSVELQRLADALHLTVKNLTLEGLKGTRAQFGISNQFRHSLAPDAGSVTFSSVKELFNHWIVAVDFALQRDWFWDGLEPDSFTILRTINIAGEEVEKDREVGSIQLKDTASMSMLQGAVDRTFTRLLFLDVIDPEQLNKDFRREIFATYSLLPNFIEDYAAADVDLVTTRTIELPITIIPHQLPQLVSAGLAMSPYNFDTENYRSSNERLKYLWFEFQTPPDDSEDTYFGRILAHAPDPYLCRVDEALISGNVEDAPFALNEEKIREIIPNMTNDFAGIGLMQELIPETSVGGTKTYLLPIPPGLHANSDELFGFFTYEIRVGHKKESWSTAQGRYGRPLKVNGVQHPTPELVCSVFRSERKLVDKIIRYIEITAPYANAVLNGKNISSFPPTTSLWYLMYTQVMQADGETFRNILIDSGPMKYRPRKTAIRGKQAIRQPGNRMGKSRIPIQSIGDKLEQLGLERSNNISVIAVEMFPANNIWQHTIYRGKEAESPQSWDDHYLQLYEEGTKLVNPLTDQLGQHRIYRSSVLTPVTEVCCEGC